MIAVFDVYSIFVIVVYSSLVLIAIALLFTGDSDIFGRPSRLDILDKFFPSPMKVIFTFSLMIILPYYIYLLGMHRYSTGGLIPLEAINGTIIFVHAFIFACYLLWFDHNFDKRFKGIIRNFGVRFLILTALPFCSTISMGVATNTLKASAGQLDIIEYNASPALQDIIDYAVHRKEISNKVFADNCAFYSGELETSKKRFIKKNMLNWLPFVSDFEAKSASGRVIKIEIYKRTASKNGLTLTKALFKTKDKPECGINLTYPYLSKINTNADYYYIRQLVELINFVVLERTSKMNEYERKRESTIIPYSFVAVLSEFGIEGYSYEPTAETAIYDKIITWFFIVFAAITFLHRAYEGAKTRVG